MNNLAEKPGDPPETETEPEGGTADKGTNLVLLYCLLALALLAAMGFAAMIVWPFYKAR
jgi:hypothetical protein